MPKKVWPAKLEQPPHWEVILWALIFLKAVYYGGGGVGSRPKFTAHQSATSLSDDRVNLKGRDEAWFVSISKSLETYSGKSLSPSALFNAFCKINGHRSTAKFQKKFRDGIYASTWKAILDDHEFHRPKLQAVFETANQVTVDECVTDSDEDVTDEESTSTLGEQYNLFSGVGCLAGTPASKERLATHPFKCLIDTTDDDNFLKLNPNKCMDLVREHCPLVYEAIGAMSLSGSDDNNTKKTRAYKLTMAFFLLVSARRVASERCFPVVALFVAMFLFGMGSNPTITGIISGFGITCVPNTLNRFLKKRQMRERSEEVREKRYPQTDYLMLIYDNYYRKGFTVKQQVFGRKTPTIEGTQRLATTLDVPLVVVPGEGEPRAGVLTLKPDFVLNDRNGAEKKCEQDIEIAKRRVIHLEFKKLKAGVKPPSPQVVPDVARAKSKTPLHTLEFSEHSSGTVLGNREIRNEFAREFHLKSSPPGATREYGPRNLAYIVGDQVTYAHMQKNITLCAMLHGAWDFTYPIPGDFHMYWHVLAFIMDIYWEAGLEYFVHELSRTGIKRQATTGKFELQHDFIISVYQGALVALVRAFLRAHPRSPLNPSPQSIKAYVGQLGLGQRLVWEPTVPSEPSDAQVEEGITHLLKWGEECSKVDKTFAFWFLFVTVHCVRYLEFRRAVRTGNGEMIAYLYLVFLPWMLVCKKNKYALLIIQHRLDELLHPSWTVKLLAFRRTVCLGFREGHNITADMACELVNGLCKFVYGGTATFECLQRTTPNLDLIKSCVTLMKDYRGLDISGKSARVNNSKETNLVASCFYSAFSFDPNRKTILNVFGRKEAVACRADLRTPPARVSPNQHANWKGADVLLNAETSPAVRKQMEQKTTILLSARTEAHLSCMAADELVEHCWHVEPGWDPLGNGVVCQEADHQVMSILQPHALEIAKTKADADYWASEANAFTGTDWRTDIVQQFAKSKAHRVTTLREGVPAKQIQVFQKVVGLFRTYVAEQEARLSAWQTAATAQEQQAQVRQAERAALQVASVEHNAQADEAWLIREAEAMQGVEQEAEDCSMQEPMPETEADPRWRETHKQLFVKAYVEIFQLSPIGTSEADAATIGGRRSNVWRFNMFSCKLHVSKHAAFGFNPTLPRTWLRRNAIDVLKTGQKKTVVKMCRAEGVPVPMTPACTRENLPALSLNLERLQPCEICKVVHDPDMPDEYGCTIPSYFICFDLGFGCGKKFCKSPCGASVGYTTSMYENDENFLCMDCQNGQAQEDHLETEDVDDSGQDDIPTGEIVDTDQMEDLAVAFMHFVDDRGYDFDNL